MRFEILGSGPGLPQTDKNLSSIYVNLGSKAILMDAGDGCSKALLARGLSRDHLDIVLISHYHPDHIAGLFMLLQMLYLEGRSKPLEVYLPEDKGFILQTLHKMYTFETKFKFDLKLYEMAELNLRHPELRVMQNDHLFGYRETLAAKQLDNSMQAWSIRLDAPEGALVYTADIGTTACIRDLLLGADTVIVDALHPEADEILALDTMNIGKVLLNHGISQELEDRLAHLNHTLFELAVENVIYEI